MAEMAREITIDLPIEKVREHLLKYFETRDDIKLESAEPNSVNVRASGWRPPPWMSIKIGMFGEEDKTRLGFNFGFRMVYVIMTLAVVMGIMILWACTLIRPENIGVAIGIIIGILVWTPISLTLEISKAKKKFLTDIRKSFALLNKTD